jgi:choline dehydrogenase-like flavoprotein
MSEGRVYDFCIVGAGIAGGLLAEELSRAGRSVIVIEAGDHFRFDQRLDLLRHRQTMAGALWPWERAERDIYVDSSESSLGVRYPLERYRIKAVGGSTLHWNAHVSRLMPSDFRTASLYGTGLDWPLSYDDLEPYYSRAEWTIGVAGNPGGLQPPRSRDYPMPGFPYSIDEQMWLPVLERLGIPGYSSAYAINSQPFDGRSACLGFAACEVCPSGARYSADVHVMRAVATGRCELLTNTVARRIEVGSSNRVAAIHASTLDGKALEIHAGRYVIAAHAVESARLLLLSKCGNHADQVGRNFMEHIGIEAHGLLPEKRFYPNRVGFERLETLFYYDGAERRERGALKVEFQFEHDPLADLSPALWGRALAQHDRGEFGHWLNLEVETEMQPKPDSRVTLDTERKDLFGDPAPHIHFALDQTDRRTHAKAREVASELLEASGAREITPRELSSNSFDGHHMGTCRMSKDPDMGVVDEDCRVHGISNLYVTGSSVFPTCGALQPTLTIAALSLRLASHLAQRRG